MRTGRSTVALCCLAVSANAIKYGVCDRASLSMTIDKTRGSYDFIVQRVSGATTSMELGANGDVYSQRSVEETGAYNQRYTYLGERIIEDVTYIPLLASSVGVQVSKPIVLPDGGGAQLSIVTTTAVDGTMDTREKMSLALYSEAGVRIDTSQLDHEASTTNCIPENCPPGSANSTITDPVIQSLMPLTAVTTTDFIYADMATAWHYKQDNGTAMKVDNTTGTCATEFTQCGGQTAEGTAWQGCCTAGNVCEYQSPFYSQCQKNLNCGVEWSQCGGVVNNLPFAGARCCQEGLVCAYKHAWYSQCLKPEELIVDPVDSLRVYTVKSPSTVRSFEVCRDDACAETPAKPAILPTQDGGFIVSWGSGMDTRRARAIAANGNMLGQRFDMVNTNVVMTGGYLDSGYFLVFKDPATSAYSTQIYSGAGVALADAVRVLQAPEAGVNVLMAASATADGMLATVWTTPSGKTMLKLCPLSDAGLTLLQQTPVADFTVENGVADDADIAVNQASTYSVAWSINGQANYAVWNTKAGASVLLAELPPVTAAPTPAPTNVGDPVIGDSTGDAGNLRTSSGSGSKGSLSTGAIAGIAIAAALVFLLGVAFGSWRLKKQAADKKVPFKGPSIYPTSNAMSPNRVVT